MITLSGFYADEENKKNAALQLDSFFREELGVEVVIDEFYYIGNFVPKNIVITFQNINDKREVFRNVTKIKNFVNKDGRKIIIKRVLHTRKKTK